MKFKSMATCPNMPTEEELAHARAVLEQQSKSALYAKEKAELVCNSCGKTQLVEDSAYIESYYYEHAFGCTGGAEWHRDTARDRVTCNHCGVDGLIGTSPLSTCTNLFKSVKTSHQGLD
jgi:hypothetical protein